MAEYNVGYLKDAKNQIFIPYTYTQSVKIDDNGKMLDSEFNKALNNISQNTDNIGSLGTRITEEVKTLNDTITSTAEKLGDDIIDVQREAAEGLSNLSDSIENTFDGFKDTLDDCIDGINNTKDRVKNLETKTSIFQSFTDGENGDSVFQITDQNGKIGFQVSDGNTYSCDFIMAKDGESEISLKEFYNDTSNWMDAADKVLDTTDSIDTNKKIYLIGATSQAENQKTYSHDTVYVAADGKLYSNSKEVVNLSDEQNLTKKTYNGYTLADACAKGVRDYNSSTPALTSDGKNLVTEQAVYHSLPTINNSHTYTNSTSIYAPISGGTSEYVLKANGVTSTPTWISQIDLSVGYASLAAVADYAVQLQTAKKINGTAFNGSADITTANWGTARNINITDGNGHNSTVVSVNGSGNVTLKLPTTIQATFIGDVTGNVTGNVTGSSGSCTGNAATATALKTARNITIGNKTNSFNGSSAISYKLDEIGAMAQKPSYIEMYPGSTSAGHGGYIDFHYNNSDSDYTSRIIAGSGTIEFETTAGINIKGGDIKIVAGNYDKGSFDYGKSIIFFDKNGFDTKNRLGMFQCYQTSSGQASEVWMKAMQPVSGSTAYTGLYVQYFKDGTTKSGSNAPFYGAVWNDYAEFRQYKDSDEIPYGHVVIENGDDSLSLSTQRLQKGGNICSDTFGFAIGETENTKMPIAVAGRALVYTYEDRNNYEPGDAVCTGPNGTISKMTQEEIKEYPDRIIGYVSAIPDYEIWGEKNTIVDGRIWIKVV